jgi:hypothetical protein
MRRLATIAWLCYQGNDLVTLRPQVKADDRIMCKTANITMCMYIFISTIALAYGFCSNFLVLLNTGARESTSPQNKREPASSP